MKESLMNGAMAAVELRAVWDTVEGPLSIAFYAGADQPMD
jgi:hypothetical protein